MAAEYLANAVQAVTLGSPVIFTASSIPCRKGYIYHEDETGIFILRGITNGQCFATYQVTFNANIAIPEGGTAVPIAIAVTLNGEPRPTSRAIYSPTVVGDAGYGNVTSTAIVKIPRGCCFSLSVEYVDADADTATTPAPVINVQNANLVIDRIA